MDRVRRQDGPCGRSAGCNSNPDHHAVGNRDDATIPELKQVQARAKLVSKKEGTTWVLRSVNDMKHMCRTVVVDTKEQWDARVAEVGTKGLIFFGHHEGTRPLRRVLSCACCHAPPPPSRCSPATSLRRQAPTAPTPVNRAAAPRQHGRRHATTAIAVVCGDRPPLPGGGRPPLSRRPADPKGALNPSSPPSQVGGVSQTRKAQLGRHTRRRRRGRSDVGSLQSRAERAPRR